MGMEAHQNVVGSSRMEIGEIDTSAPFESVKAAVSMFGESAFSRYQPTMRKPKSQSSERIFAKETLLHLAQKELNKYKDQLENCDITRTNALGEVDKAKRTVADLTQKLKTIDQSKEMAINVTETAKSRITELEDGSSSQDTNSGLWKQELDSATEQYAVADAALGVAKQELRRLRKEFETSMDAKISAIRKEEEAKLLVDINNEQANLLSEDITSVKESIMHEKLASMQAKEEKSKIVAEKDTLWQSYKVMLQETERKLASLLEEFDSELVGKLETKLAETTTEIGLLQKEMENATVSDLDSVTTVRTELDDAKDVLQNVVEEKDSLENLRESLSLELETIKKEHLKLKEKEAGSESLAGNLHLKLQESKAELEMAISRESKAKAALDDLKSTLKQLSSESDNARKSAEMFRTDAEVHMTEAKAAQITLHEAEEKLYAALRDAEEAKDAEAKAQNQINLLSDRADMARSSTSKSGANVTISPEEFESLSRKAEESKLLSDIKIAAAMARVEAVKASENEAIKKLEAVREETKEIELATQEALKNATMAEAARMAIDGEVKRRREREQKRAAEAASQKPPEVETYKNPLPPKAGVAKSDLMNVKTMMEKTTITKKTIIPNLGGVKFLSKKNQLEGGSPSYVPGKKSGLPVLLDLVTEKA